MLERKLDGISDFDISPEAEHHLVALLKTEKKPNRFLKQIPQPDEHKPVIKKVEPQISQLETKINDLTRQVQELRHQAKSDQLQHEKEIKELSCKIKTRQEMHDEDFLEAAEQGKIKKIKSALNMNANILSKNKFGQTAFYLSVVNERRDAADFILTQAPALFMEGDIYGMTPIQELGKTGKLFMLDWLYEKGKSIPEFKDNQAQFDRLYAVSNEDAKIFLANKKLLDSAKVGDMAGVRDALKKGALINIKGEDGETALYRSVYFEYDQMTQLLLENGADPTIRNNKKDEIVGIFHESVLELAKTKNNPVLTSMIATSFLIHAAIRGSQEDIIVALEAGANLAGTDKDRQTALHKAVKACNIDIIKLLLEKHAKLNIGIHIPDINSATPYQLACQFDLTVKTKKGEKNLAIMLLEKYGSYKRQSKIDAKTMLSSSPHSLIASLGGVVGPAQTPISDSEKSNNKALNLRR